MNVHVTKTVPIEYSWVVSAYQRVRQGGKSAGIDGESWEAFDKNAGRNCYVIWNRLASGSYHPQPVREVEIPKGDGRLRKLGIPTLRNRISQQVVKEYMEKRIDAKFHDNSYGYRPMKSAHEALKAVSKNCQIKSWVVDIDIKSFFDEIDQEKLLLGVSHILPATDWVLMYIQRWLEMPVQDKSGHLHSREGKGTPQGGVISPLLANIYLHYSLDKWLNREYPGLSFVRYADDIVIHCETKLEAEKVLSSVKARLSEVKLGVNESKTKIVYCKDYRRRENHEEVQFEFLGFSFQPMSRKSQYNQGWFTGYG